MGPPGGLGPVEVRHRPEPEVARLVQQFQAPEGEKDNWTAKVIAKTYLDKLRLLEDRLALGEFVAGDAFTAADISVGYGLFLGRLLGLHEQFPQAVADYFARLKARPAYQRAVAV